MHEFKMSSSGATLCLRMGHMMADSALIEPKYAILALNSS
jgi:hypothetical protein